MRLLVVTVMLLLAPVLQAASVLGIVSERSAAEVAAGAHRFLQQHPEHRVLLRTPEQLAEIPDAELIAFWRDVDAVFLTAVFGDQAGRLERLMREQPPRAHAPVLAINSTRQITRLSRLGGRQVMAGVSEEQLNTLTANPDPGQDPREHLQDLQANYPDQAAWLQGRAYYQGRSPEHIANLMRWLLNEAGHTMAVTEPRPGDSVRYYRGGIADADDLKLQTGPVVAVLNLDYGDRPGDRDVLDAICEGLEQRNIQCVGVLARWGGASVEAVTTLQQHLAPASLSAVVSMQDFTVGGGDGRRDVTHAFEQLNVPVIKGITLSGVTESEWLLSVEGIARDEVHYKLAMPELQGVSQPQVLALGQAPQIDSTTGVRFSLNRPVPERLSALVNRLARWHALQSKANADKRIALVYYNHPPGRHNVGADKLDVPESLFEMLQQLKARGYHTGELPESAEALHDLIQDRGINLIDSRSGLEDLAGRVPALSREEYLSYFRDLPSSIRAELENGPVGYLHERLKQAVAQEEPQLAAAQLSRGINDLRHMLDSHKHPARERALDLLAQYEQSWQTAIKTQNLADELTALRDALIRTGIPGLTGWGSAPGEAMVHQGQMLFPGLHFGNVFIGPQPPRGWEVSEALLHANTSFPPTHHYVGFYHWLRDHYQADALVYVGRHSTREFLPRRRAGLASDDYPELLGGDLPVIYPYIVDGVGEGIQAKRRAMGVMISHLTPPLAATELYDQLLELRQLVESYEAAIDPDSPTRLRAVAVLRERLRELNLEAEIEEELAQDHHGHHNEDHNRHRDEDERPHRDEESTHSEPNLDGVDDDLLVHEVGHYLTELQERFMPLGLHVFGRNWSPQALDTMLASMAGGGDIDPAWRDNLAASPGEEMANWLAALEGRFVPPGQGNDPLRTPAVLPTGRNFHAISGDLIPTRVAWSLGRQLAGDARERGDAQAEGSEAIVLWASDTVRDEGVMIAFGLDMLGVRPRWNARGIVESLERVPLDVNAGRRDVLFTTSGLFRDLYGDQLDWLDLAVRLALDGASHTIRRQHPQLARALDAALQSLPDAMRDPGDEALQRNAVAARWVMDTRALLQAGADAERAGREAAWRVFGTAPGAYGAGVNRLAERSGAWEDRREVADVYRRRMGHVYGKGLSGEPAHDAFGSRLHGVGRTYLGRASHVYGLLDNDDGFDFQGGLSLAVETLSGRAPDNRVLMHADAANPRVETLQRALLSELRARNLNPQWLKPLMDHGYAGARTMSADFLDNLWGWQVTSPEVVRSWVWDAVHDVYFRDSLGIGLDSFLEEGHNVHVKTHMQAIALVAAHRSFWEADAAVIDALAQDFARLVVEHGLPGGGHTRPDHPTMNWVAERLDAELREAFDALRAAAQLQRAVLSADPVRIAELAVADSAAASADIRQQKSRGEVQAALEGGYALLPWLLALGLLALLIAGVIKGSRPRL